MGARVGRLFRDFNLENRVHRELSKDKPRAAPRHGQSVPPQPGSSTAADRVNHKDESLLDHLRSVYVQSAEPPSAPPPAAAQALKAAAMPDEAERRPLRFHLPVPLHGLQELSDIPKGKLTIAEALKVLGSHQHQPTTWTPERIAQEFSLDLKDTKAFVEFFIPFKVEIIPPRTGAAKPVKAS